MTIRLSKPKHRMDAYLHALFQDKFDTSKISNKKTVEIENNILDEKPTYDVVKPMTTKSNVHPRFRKINQVYVHPHAWERWNERVGPRVEKNDLIALIRMIVFNFPERLTMESEASELASIDGDIIFGFKIKKDTLKINTFYGRKSLNGLLCDIDSLRVFNKMQNDRVKLEIDKEVLASMKMPLVPSKYIQFNVYKREIGKSILIKCMVFHVHSKKDNKVVPYLYFCYPYSNTKKNLKIKDYPLIMKKMNKMPLEALLGLVLLNMHGSILMYATKFEEEAISQRIYSILLAEQSRVMH